MSLEQELKEIRAAYVREDYIRNVKRRVHDYLVEIEPNADIEDTHYFNHSAIPDFVADWNNQRREIFVRSSYAEIVAGEDTAYIRSGAPVFIALDSAQELEEPDFKMSPADASKAAEGNGRTLLTDPSALDAIGEHAKGPEESPLSRLVQANFMRGARGLVDEPVAEALVNGVGLSDLGSAEDLIESRFSEDAVFRIQRTAALVRWALDEASDSALLREAIEGRLTPEELRTVLPWLLRNSTTIDRRFWRELGSLLGLEELEQIADELSGVDLTRLVGANLQAWGAKRAVVTVDFTSASAEGEAHVGAVWGIHNGVVGASVGPHLVRVSESGTRLKARAGLAVPHWDDIEERLVRYSLTSVSLVGQLRSLTLDANKSPSINDDLHRATATMEDDYVVSQVQLALEAADDEGGRAVAEAEFGSGLVSSHALLKLGPLVQASLAVITGLRVSADLLGELKDGEAEPAPSDDDPSLPSE